MMNNKLYELQSWNLKTMPLLSTLYFVVVNHNTIVNEFYFIILFLFLTIFIKQIVLNKDYGLIRKLIIIVNTI